MESPAKDSEPDFQTLLPRNLKESQRRREKEIEKPQQERKKKKKMSVKMQTFSTRIYEREPP